MVILKPSGPDERYRIKIVSHYSFSMLWWIFRRNDLKNVEIDILPFIPKFKNIISCTFTYLWNDNEGYYLEL